MRVANLGLLLAISSCSVLVACGGSSSGGDPGTAGDSTAPDVEGETPPSDTTDQPPVCGNGVVEGIEQCDNGASNGHGAGCESDCTFTCKPGDPLRGDPSCDDKNPCNGSETCKADHTCNKGTALADGASCGGTSVCKGGVCVGAVCGDGIVTAPEECVDGNAVDGDGCDSTCKFSCLSTDTARSCAAIDACRAKGSCDDAKHVCTAGAPSADGTACGTGKTCKAGTCISAACGNGVVDSGEDCDFGASNGAGTGCEIACKFSCSKSADTCSDGNACNGTESCQSVTVGSASGQKCSAGTPLADGTTCATGKICKTGACVVPPSVNCGNGTIESGEDCDFGTGNGPGTGCEPTCKFSCTKSPDSCPAPIDACAGPSSCQAVTVSGKPGQKCASGTPLAKCTACGAGSGGVCQSGACRTPTCGDGCVSAPETCEPPSTATCDASCKTVVAAVCGNGKREGTEQCDDSNVINLDGCSAKCTFEQDQRVNSMSMLYGTDAYCTVNRLGSAIQGAAQGNLQTSLTNGIKDGSTSIMLEFLNLKDLTGTSDPAPTALAVGGLSGKPVAAPAGKTYDGTNDLDWWYTVDASAIDAATRISNAQLKATITAKFLDTPTPGTLIVTLNLTSGPASVRITNAKLHANIGPTSKPTVSPGTTPGHVAGENVDPAIVTFASMSNGQMCGNVSAQSLANAPPPATILAGGALSCGEGYTTASSLLDVIVGGCHVFGFIVAISPNTQPDLSDPAMPVAGAGAPYTLVENAAHHVTSCKDKSGATVPDLTACLNAAAYSSSFKFGTDRVIVK